MPTDMARRPGRQTLTALEVFLIILAGLAMGQGCVVLVLVAGL